MAGLGGLRISTVVSLPVTVGLPAAAENSTQAFDPNLLLHYMTQDMLRFVKKKEAKVNKANKVAARLNFAPIKFFLWTPGERNMFRHDLYLTHLLLCFFNTDPCL
jgi:hypothetical protein